MNMVKQNREWGDFQTPPKLASKICRYLLQTGISPELLIEPTCGTGNFIWASLETFPKIKTIYGVEIKESYQATLNERFMTLAKEANQSVPQVKLFQADVFRHNFELGNWNASEELLIIGNPPWVTNSELGTLDSANLPIKSNFGRAGLDAMTGKSNFDLAEWVILQMLKLFSERKGHLAMLCKNSVIRKILEKSPERNFKVSGLKALQIDARAEFGAAVEASLLVMELGNVTKSYVCQTSKLDTPDLTVSTFGWLGNHFVANTTTYEQSSHVEGKCLFNWRQGIKHDCAPVMELDEIEGNWYNAAGERVEIEVDRIYPLLKSSDLKHFGVKSSRKSVIMTQHKLGEITKNLCHNAPKLWNYLEENSARLDSRKSSIYNTQPRFAMFGIGDYSFKPYKVAISGLYKQCVFSLVEPIDGRSVMLDDTCYFLGFDNYLDALFTATILNSWLVQKFLQAIVFVDAKRPYTKEILMRIDLATVATKLAFEDIYTIWQDKAYEPTQVVTNTDFVEYLVRNFGETNQMTQSSFMALV